MKERIATDLHWLEEVKLALLAKAPDWGMRIAGALITFLIGWYLIKWINRAVKRYFEVKDFDPGLESFLESLISVLLKICLILTTAATLGVELTSFMAIFGSAGIAIGLALSGTLSNFAGGIIVLLFKPYKVGDVIEAQGYIGKVDAIKIFNTYLKTLDTKTVIIPNGKLATETLVNYSMEENRKVVWSFSISYGDDVNLAKETLLELLLSEPRILKELEEPLVAVEKLAGSSVNLTVRAWADNTQYWSVFWSINEQVYNIFPQKGLHLSNPQMDLTLFKNKA
jgi:small conductance mechanosensitive channel